MPPWSRKWWHARADTTSFICTTRSSALLHLVLHAADAIVVTSMDYAASSFVGAARVDSGRVVELPGGVDVTRFTPGPAVTSPPDRPVIAFLAGLDEAHYFKGLPVLLSALQQI